MTDAWDGNWLTVIHSLFRTKAHGCDCVNKNTFSQRLKRITFVIYLPLRNASKSWTQRLESNTHILERKDAHAVAPIANCGKYIVDHPSDFGLDSIRETARKSGVSTYTLVRAANSLGFESYDQLREPFRHALVSSTGFSDASEWITNLRQEGALGRVQGDAAANTLAIIERTLSIKQLIRCCKWLICFCAHLRFI